MKLSLSQSADATVSVWKPLKERLNVAPALNEQTIDFSRDDGGSLKVIHLQRIGIGWNFLLADFTVKRQCHRAGGSFAFMPSIVRDEPSINHY